MKRFIISLFFVLLSVMSAQAAGTVARDTASDYRTNWMGRQAAASVWSVTSDGAGAVSSTSLGRFNNPIMKVQYIMDETTPPTGLISCYLHDSADTYKTDLLGGAGVSISNTENANITPMVGAVYGYQPTGVELFISCSGMGSGGKMDFVVWTIQ